MIETDIQKRILELRRELEEHNHRYYVLNDPQISDREFDTLMHTLEDLERQYPEFDDPLSPTHRVGSDLTAGFEQADHIHPMLSLANTYSPEEVDQWIQRVRTALPGQQIMITGELKFDGTGISLIYEHGRLVRAVTRGDGTRGDVVTANVKTIRSIPLQLRGTGWPDSFEIRGEIVMPWAAFERLNQERAFNEEPLFANPRNAAAGTLKTQSPAEVARRGLDAYFYYLLGDNLPFDTHSENMLAARSWGFKVSSHMTTMLPDQADAFISRMDRERRELPVATDGLVFKVDSLRQQLNLGFTAKSPRWAIAYKFAAERACTQLRTVSFEVGRMGTITPVANLDPVLLSGTIVKRASIHNEDIIRHFDLHYGDMVYVEKGGEIIPKIVDVDTDARQPGAEPVRFPGHCPACGTPLVRVEGEASWVCPNKWGCVPQITGRVEHFVGRRMMNIDGIGGETAATLFASGLVRDIADLYDLRPEQIERLDGFGPRAAERITDGIRASLEVPFERVVFALSIPGVGETTAKKVARAAGNIDRLMTMTEAELTAIEDVGPRIAVAIVDYFAAPENRAIIERLRAAGVCMAVPETAEEAGSDILGGKSFVISGVFEHHSRDDYKAMIERFGGRNVGSISKKTDYVLAGANMGPAKLEKAQKLGIPIISEDEFLSMISAE